MLSRLKTALSAFRETSLEGAQSHSTDFGVLVVGETGSGKSTLINNLLGRDGVYVDHSFESQTEEIAKQRVQVEGVIVTLYDTPGLDDSRGIGDDHHLREMKYILDNDDIHLVIYCIKLPETRMRASLFRTFKEYHKIGVKWEQTVMALTFADIPLVPSKQRKEPGFDIGSYFNRRVAEHCYAITRTLVERVGGTPEAANIIKFYPTTSDPGEILPNGERWYGHFWKGLLDLLSPSAAEQFLKIHTNNVYLSHSEKYVGNSAALSPHFTENKCHTVLKSHHQQPDHHPPQAACQEGLHSVAGPLVLQKDSASVSELIKQFTTSGTLETRQLPVSVGDSVASSIVPARLWRSVRQMSTQAQKPCPIFGILVIGETGSGKSTLINNLLGKDLAPVGDTMQSETPAITTYDVAVEGVGLSVYDTPGLDDSRGDQHETKDLEKIQALLARRKIHSVIYCFRMTERKLRRSLIHELEKYNEIGLPWQHTVMALTFADCEPKFDTRLPAVQKMLREELLKRFWVKRDAIEKMKSCPTTGHVDQPLPNGELWFTNFGRAVESTLASYCT